jgi:uncharacterized protein (DUF58 family)
MTPTRLCLGLAAGWLALGVVAALWPPGLVAWYGYGGLLGLVAAGQWWTLRRLAPIEATRDVPHALPVLVWRDVTLRLELPRTRWRWRIDAFDHHPDAAEVEGLPAVLARAPGDATAVTITYRLRATARGDARFAPIELRLEPRLSLFARTVRCGPAETVRVFPNFAVMSGHALWARDDRVRPQGSRLRRRRGTGLEFHQLREYRDGDPIRQIDWKASSRRRQLIAREYQEERDQQVVFLLDCGRRMRSVDGARSHFDEALDAVLLLAFVALRQGDAVGLATFSGHERFVPPIKGALGLRTILGRLYDLEPTGAPSDWLEAATRILQRVPRRALVVWITNMRDEDEGELRAALALLRRRHLVLLASLREGVVREVLESPVRSLGDALAHCAAHRYAADRQRVHDDLRRGGVMVLDTAPRELPPRLVDRYLEVKRAGLL